MAFAKLGTGQNKICQHIWGQASINTVSCHYIHWTGFMQQKGAWKKKRIHTSGSVATKHCCIASCGEISSRWICSPPRTKSHFTTRACIQHARCPQRSCPGETLGALAALRTYIEVDHLKITSCVTCNKSHIITAVWEHHFVRSPVLKNCTKHGGGFVIATLDAKTYPYRSTRSTKSSQEVKKPTPPKQCAFHSTMNMPWTNVAEIASRTTSDGTSIPRKLAA